MSEDRMEENNVHERKYLWRRMISLLLFYHVCRGETVVPLNSNLGLSWKDKEIIEN